MRIVHLDRVEHSATASAMAMKGEASLAAYGHRYGHNYEHPCFVVMDGNVCRGILIYGWDESTREVFVSLAHTDKSPRVLSSLLIAVRKKARELNAEYIGFKYHAENGEMKFAAHRLGAKVYMISARYEIRGDPVLSGNPAADTGET